MRKQILFIHSAGTQGPNEGSDGLIRHIREDLGDQYEIINPMMPNPDYPEYAPWKTRLKKGLSEVENGIILIGHSLGGSVLLKCLSEDAFDKRIAGLFLIATPYWGEKDWEVAEFKLEEDFNQKLPDIPSIFLYHSRNDNMVPYSHMEIYAQKFPSAVIREFGGNDHAFDLGIPELVRDIKNLKSYDRSF